MTNLETLSDGAAPKLPSITVAKPQPIRRRGLSGVAADEPDRAGMFIAVFFVLSTLLAVTVALGYVILNS